MSSDISQADLDYIEELFDKIDIDQDGTISIQELAKGILILILFIHFDD